MQFDWTTFSLEILNFIVLLWVLKRFLYKPVLGVLDARQRAIRDQAARAEAARKEAEDMKTQYEARLDAWKGEREQARQALEQELSRDKAAKLEELRRLLDEERARAAAREEAAAAAREAALAQRADAQAYGKVSALLRRLSSAELTARIVKLFEEDMQSLPADEAQALRDAAAAMGRESAAEVVTAHAIDDDGKRRIAQALSAAAAHPLQPSFKQDAALMAGVRVSLGQCLLHANLADELEFFREHGHSA